MKHLFVFYFILICNLLSVRAQNPVKEFPVIPRPSSVQVVGGNYDAKQISQLVIPAKSNDAIRIGKGIAALLELSELKINKQSGNILPKSRSITLSLIHTNDNPDYYKLHITKNGIWIQAVKPSGWFYGLQTLTQMIELSDQSNIKNKLLPYCIIEDQPAFSYRGLHLDVSRHFYPVSFIKSYLDMMSRFKYNSFHWHLTDDQGWRIEIKKFPKLTTIGSTRKNTLIGKHADYPQKFDSIAHSGYYTQDQIRDIIHYADERFIQIIPEIEMPGHATAALAAYPEFACKDSTVEVSNEWGVFNTGQFCTKDTSIWFVKEILNEVADLFPGKYIHIGGDECPKENWKACDNCQAVKRRNNLKTEEELQSYFIKQVELFLSKKGKQLIGWDEILEGGLAPNAIVMSWRGNDGGIAAAKQKHPVIMTPGTHCYFDHYQSLYPNEPLAIGGYTSLSKTYSFNPIPVELKAEERKYIMGAQGNVWTEYIDDESKVWYMTYPRAIALAEVNWTAAPNKDYRSFLTRLQYHIPWFKSRNLNITQSMLDLEYSTRTTPQGVVLYLKRPDLNGKVLIESKINGDLLSEYILQDSFILNRDIAFKAWFQTENNFLGKPLTLQYKNHLATAKKLTIVESPSPRYFYGDINVLVNGIDAPAQKYNGPEWIGFEGKDMNADIDLGKPDSLQLVNIQFYHYPGAWIHRPNELEISTSTDGIVYSAPVRFQISETETRNIFASVPLPHGYGRYVHLSVKNHGIIEDKLPGAGHPAWLFVGEIEVR
jgi:hexosaminidase